MSTRPAGPTAGRTEPAEWIAALRDAAAAARAKAGEASLSVAVGSHAIRIRVAPEGLRELLRPLAGVGGSIPDGPTIELWEVAACEVRGPRLPPEAQEAGRRGAIPWLSSPSTAAVWQEPGPMLMAWDAEQRTVCGWIADSATLPAWERAAPLRVAFNWALRGSRRTLAHAAAVGMAGGGPGLLIGGASGSGKSTTALSWLLADGDFAGDDYVLVDLDGPGGPIAAPIYATAKADPAALRLLPELAAAATGAEDDLAGKSILDVRDLRPEQPRGPIPIAAIVVPRVAQRTRPAVTQVTGAAALRSVAPSSLLQLPEESGGLSVLAALAREVPCYEIELARDPAANLSALEEILPP